jgi:small multidrug resistance family-3 protein
MIGIGWPLPGETTEKSLMQAVMVYAAAAVAEIAGSFAFWSWMRQGGSAVWLLPGLGLLATFAWLLTLAPTDHAGRAYAVYGGIYIAASISWLWAVDGIRPDRWDLIGSVICLVGAAVILWGPRGSMPTP